jgi:cephalosporin hydroxylase
MDLIGRGRVIGIDVDHGKINFDHPRITWITGDANSTGVLSKVDSTVSKSDRVMVIEDSSHTYENTLSVLRNYNHFVTPQMYFIVEDGVCKYPFIEDGPKPGPFEAVHDFLRENDSFVIDKSRERFTLTLNPDGFLRRVK